MKQVFLLVALVALSTTSWAQTKKGKIKFSAAHKEALKNQRTSIEQDFAATQAKIDAALSAEELQIVTTQREERLAMRTSRRALIKRTRKMSKAGKTAEEIENEVSADKKALRKQKKAIKKAVKPVLSKHQDMLVPLVSQLKEKRANWKKERMDIHKKHLSEADFQKLMARKDARKEKKMAEKDAKKMKKSAKKKSKGTKLKGGRILLWSGKNASAIDFEEELNEVEND